MSLAGGLLASRLIVEARYEGGSLRRVLQPFTGGKNGVVAVLLRCEQLILVLS